MIWLEALTGTTEYLTLYTGCRIDRCRYKRVRLYIAYNLYEKKWIVNGKLSQH